MSIENSVQISDGLTQTSADGACLWFDKMYGIMFCVYMPGMQGNYGESRSKISLSYFPASQPTNIKFIDISSGNDEYLPNIVGLGDGKVRIFYEKFSRAEGDHPWCYKDFDFLTNTLGEEKRVMIKKSDSTVVPYSLSVVFEYLESIGLYNHKLVHTEQIGCCTPFTDNTGCTYGAAVSYLSEVALFKSDDNMATIEFFAAYPKPVQYEFDYRILKGVIHAVYRTEKQVDSIYYTSSHDMGKTWTNPIVINQSVSCRPRLLCVDDNIIMAYNHYNTNSGNRPGVIQGRCAVRIRHLDNKNPNDCTLLADIHSKYGIVNISVANVLGDLYMAYSTSELAMEYQNGTPWVRGKDAVRYVKLGDLIGK